MTSHSNTPGNVVWLNGTFDVLHPGHFKLFRYARMLAGANGTVHVGVDTDERVAAYKGPSRPVNMLITRTTNLLSLNEVDYVSIFASNSQLESLICDLKPKFMVIGDDYRGREIIGAQYIEKIIYITRDKHSSTKLINDR